MIGHVDIQNLDQSSYSDCLLYKEYHQLVSIYSMCQNQDRQNQDLEKLFWITLLLLWLLCNQRKHQLQWLQPFSTCLRTCFSFFGCRLTLKLQNLLSLNLYSLNPLSYNLLSLSLLSLSLLSLNLFGKKGLCKYLCIKYEQKVVWVQNAIVTFPLLISTGFLKYSLELKKISVSLYWIFFFSSNL